MNKIKKIKLITLVLSFFSVSQAEYIIKIDLDKNVVFKSWSSIDPTKTEWTDTGNIYQCSNWTPLASTITVGQNFLQTSTECKQDQSRTIQEREQDSGTNDIRDVGVPYTEQRTITVSDSQQSIGSLETWVASTPEYTEWVNNGVVTNCTNWTPAATTVTAGQSFPQTATDCQQAQTRSRQDREQETTTGAYRYVGNEVIESKNITASSTQNAVGTKSSCIYSATDPVSMWKYRTGGNMITIFYEGATIHVFSSSTQTSYTKNGYTYTRGTVQNAVPSITDYSVCRT